ncbi:MAG TPA: hypothetical protein GYA06_02910 [Chloroflexi bacterium]|nr:hypothetical protein [Chloroflexota bacterium]HPO58445.1 hypothetical protein [Anaerolineaceae bacterium]
MKRFLARLTGLLLILDALLGFGLSVAGLVVIWTSQSTVLTRVTSTMDTIEMTVAATTNMLDVVNTTLDQAGANIQAIEASLIDVTAALSTASNVADTVGTMIGEDFTRVIAETQTSLDSVETSAKLIDDTLRIVSAVPFIGARYRPEVPLQETISAVNLSLDELPASFAVVQSELEQTSTSVDNIQRDLDNLSMTIGEIETSLTEAKVVLEQYRTVVQILEQEIASLEANLPRWLDYASWSLTIGLIWLLFAQIPIFLVGLALITRGENNIRTYYLPSQGP